VRILAPDLLADVCELSPAIIGSGLALGVALWLLGWKGHRFWIVLTATLAGGIAGLSNSASYGVQPLVAGLLAAVAAGVLALALVRVVAFVAGSLAACMIVHSLAPSWDQPLLTALVGGLIAIFLFRFWTMVLTSMIGTLLIGFTSLALLDSLKVMAAVPWAVENGVLLNWLWGSLSLVGLLIQFLTERHRLRRRRQREEQAREKAAKEAEKKRQQSALPPPPARGWWAWGFHRISRKAS
jgi:hypothetical protein